MDEHLNVFYQYCSKENDGIREDNITRATLVTFDKLSYHSKIAFINKIIGKTALNEECMDYDFVLELQDNWLRDDVISIANKDKYLCAFSTTGMVNDESNHETVVDMIYHSPSDHDSRPDGCILVKQQSKPILAIVFENKLHDLNPKQLKRHFVEYMGITDKNDMSNSFLLYSYGQFYKFFESDEGLNSDLLEYINISGYILPQNYQYFKKSKYNIRRNVEYLNSCMLNKIKKNSTLGYQTGWGPILMLGDENRVINMIGLIYFSDTDEIELNIRFAPTMSKARYFYRRLRPEAIERISRCNSFNTEIRIQLMFGYIEQSCICFNNVGKFLNYFSKNCESVFHKYEKPQLLSILNDLSDFTGDPIPDNYGNGSKFNHGRLCLCPSLIYTKRWKIPSIGSNENLLKEINDCIAECEEITGFEIIL